MERNADDTFGATGNQHTGSTRNAENLEPIGSGMASTNAPPGGLDFASDSTADNSDQSTGLAATTGRTPPKFDKVREKARELQSTLADRLDAGAERLRQRNANATLAGATDAGNVTVASDERVTNVQDSVAQGMNKSADWLRNGDLKTDIERQVRENPGRTLLIALGVGYLLGKAFRNNNR